MSQFYVSIIFIGIVLIIISFIWILFDRKQAYDYSNGIDEKKTELLGIIGDAEEMLEELNKFSDYMIEKMDSKNEELNEGLKKIDDRLKQLDSELKESLAVKTYKTERVSNGGNYDFIGISGTQFESYGREHENENKKFINQGVAYHDNYVQHGKAKEKVIPLSGKYKEVIRLSENGLSITEIAKNLHMGKGEIQLILGMNK